LSDDDLLEPFVPHARNPFRVGVLGIRFKNLSEDFSDKRGHDLVASTRTYSRPCWKDLFFLSLSSVGNGVPDLMTNDPSNSAGPGFTTQSFSDTTPRIFPSALPLYTSASPSIVHKRGCHVLNILSARYLSRKPVDALDSKSLGFRSFQARALTFVLPL
jgi:hypothetical protein